MYERSFLFSCLLPAISSGEVGGGEGGGGGALAHERGRSARSREGEERRSREGRGVGKSGRGKWWAVSDGGVFISDSARVSSDSAGGVLSFLPAVGLFLEIFPTVPAAW